MNYAEKLKDPRWQKKRLQILERDSWTCQTCQDNTSTLHVHHFYYRKGIQPWEYSDQALITVCEHCHKMEHSNLTELESELWLMATACFEDSAVIQGIRDVILKYKAVEQKGQINGR